MKTGSEILKVNLSLIYVGVILSMGICSKLLKLSDQMVGFLGGISQFGGCILYAVAINKVMMYLGKYIFLFFTHFRQIPDQVAYIILPLTFQPPPWT